MARSASPGRPRGLRSPSSSFAAAASVALLAAAGRADAQGYQPPNSLRWPLSHGSPAAAREAVGNSFGEYQAYNGDPAYVHSGVDIRGKTGDPVRLVAGGNVWLTANFDDDGCVAATNCRLYVKGNDRRYIYYYSHLRLAPAGEEFTSEVREKIINAAGPPAHDPRPGTDVGEGQVLAGLAAFASGAWPHLHFGIVDSTQSYDAINPLTALRRAGDGAAIFDDERPTISALELVRDGQHAALSAPACGAIDGAVDLAATMKDSFYTTGPAPAPVDGQIDSIGVYEASYLIRQVGTSLAHAGTWYRFDRAPLRCAGPDRGLACLPNLSEADFFDQSINAEAGALTVAEPYVAKLFSTARSQSPYNDPANPERYVHFLTNAWGEEGRWDTADDPDGYYQISVEARDADGNAAARSRFVLVDNHGTLAPKPDAHVRDNPVDVGALPSTLGGEPFWASPDIFVLPAGSPAPGPDDSPPGVLLDAGAAYDVYVRVTNGSCAPVEGVRAQVYSADPSTINDAASWGAITLPAGSFVTDAAHPAGLALAPAERALLGPFPWTPTAAEAASNEGHRCLLAKIDAAADPVGTAEVPDNNNVAQRNVQFSDTSFSLGNPETKRYNAELSLACNGFPYAAPGAVLELKVAYHPALAAAWAQAEGVTLTVDASFLTVRFGRCRVDLPPALLPGLTLLPASFKLVPPPGIKGEWRVDLAQRLDGSPRGGMSFTARGI